MTYVMADIHGAYDRFTQLLSQLDLQEEDTLYVLGDILDRGTQPLRVIRHLMEMPNAVCLAGNHELMAMDCLPFLLREITDESIAALDHQVMDNLQTWLKNGSASTLREFRTLHTEERQDILDFLGDLELYAEVEVEGREYLLVHAGLGTGPVRERVEEYSLKEILWDRADYSRTYFTHRYVVSGHTPTQMIPGNPRPGYIYQANHHIAIDCGAYLPDGRLAAIRLEDGAEFYAE